MLVLYMHFTEGIENVYRTLKTINLGYFALALLVVLLSTVYDVGIKHFIRSKYQKVPFSWTLYASLFQIAPSSLLPGILQAGLCSEVAIYVKQGLSFDESSSVILVKSIASFAVACVISIVLWFSNLAFFTEHTDFILRLFFLMGLLINIVTVFYYIFIGRFDKFLFFLAKILISILACIKVIKNKQEALDKAREQLEKLKNTMSGLSYTFFDWAFICVASAIGVFIGYFTSYLLCKCLGIVLTTNIFVFFAALNAVSTITVVFSIPGGIGIADLAYAMLLQPIVGDKINYLLLLWRITTFYFPLILSAITMAFKIPGENSNIQKEENNPSPPHEQYTPPPELPKYGGITGE